MTLTDLSRRLRWAPFLREQEWAWRIARPVYESLLRQKSRRGGIRRTVNGRQLRLRYPVARHVEEEYEPDVHAGLAGFLQPGMVVFDIGASYGIHAIQATAFVTPSGRVYAFEPASATAAILRDHVSLNGVGDRVEIVEAAVDERPGTVHFWESTISTMASFSKAWTEADPTSGAASSPVAKTEKRAVSIDSFCRERGVWPDLVKIDVEGAEARVLRGATDFLARRRGRLLVEVHPDGLAALGDPATAVSELLAEAGWSLTEIGRSAGTVGEAVRYVSAPA